ncbi:L-threonine O-3-phosphate decarboxylase [Pacificibacter maritimus]|uniref:Aminotransferase n=1 Tax=Pacificibacter maritimus TaxID=762213 RepID=A0A3N4UR78_9RHOB|nr:threonine-phosphate decarboxylase [Pacificibacter maritimus]RPE63194.1 L-threonine O-3-phosphate decarboxylase [Pacificibacter maritimus]
MKNTRDHGGGLDAAVDQFGGTKDTWVDLSTGINPVPYPIGDISTQAWAALPDQAAQQRLADAARNFWNVPEDAAIIAAPGASSLIACMPQLTDHIGAYIPKPTYNEHAAAFRAHSKLLGGDDRDAQIHVYVHPNNPDGRLWPATQMGGRALTVIDESFCDVAPEASHIELSADHGTVVLKSFGKFWGLAGLRLGFAIARHSTLHPEITLRKGLQKERVPDVSLTDMLGPWAVSGPALEIGARALEDTDWAQMTRIRLSKDAARLDRIMTAKGATSIGGTTLFRLYEVDNASAWQTRLAKGKVWSRIFPYSKSWLRLGLPAPDQWDQLEAAL